MVRTTNDEHSGGSTNAHNILSSEQEHASMAAALGLKDVFELYYHATNAWRKSPKCDSSKPSDAESIAW